MNHVFIQIIPYFFWLLIIFLLAYSLFLGISKKIVLLTKIPLIILLLASCVVLIDSFWLERYVIQIQTHQPTNSLVNKKIALLSDIHAGNWKDQDFLSSIVARLNDIPDLDLVVIGGDWTYFPEQGNLTKLFSPLKNSKAPVYGVLGNHDLEKPGEPIRKELSEALSNNEVTLIDNTVLAFQDFNLVGLGDNWAGEDDTRTLETVNLDHPTVVLTHNPDSTLNYSNSFRKKVSATGAQILTLTGHTHCGQVRLPFIYRSQIPVTDHYYDKGWYSDSAGSGFFSPISENNLKISGNNLFISCGIGEVGLPLRLFNPATIDVIDLKL